MLQIRLSTIQSSEGGGVAKPAPADSVTVACPDHLVLADLLVAKGLGSATASALVKTVGRKSRRHLGERVHFCVRCDFPIAIYGRLSPCEHAFCLDCARSDSICYLCEERIQKIQTIKMMEGIYVCAAPHCLKSFMKKSEFESHIQKNHFDLLQSHNALKNNGNESEPKQSAAASESTARAPPKIPFSPNSTDNDDKSRVPQLQHPPRPFMQQQPMPMPFPPQYFGQFQTHPSDSQLSHNPPPGFPPNFQPLSYPQFPMEGGAQYFYGIPHDMARPDSASEVKPEQGGSLLSFPQPWNMVHGFPNMVDAQGRAVFFEGGNYGQNMPAMPLNMPNLSTNNTMDMDPKGVSAPQQPSAFPPLPLMPPHRFSQPKQEE